MFIKFRKKIEDNRNSPDLFWRILVRLKDCASNVIVLLENTYDDFQRGRSGETMNRSFFYWFDLFLYRVNLFLRHGTANFYYRVEVETNTACNRRCCYCPNSIFERGLIKNKKLMEIELFHKIVDELAELGFRGKFFPYGFGEPLLDDRLPELIAYARKKLPKVLIHLNTNGDYLSLERYLELIKAGVDTFDVSLHGPEMPKGVKNVLDYRKQHDNNTVVFFYHRVFEQARLSNRGGLVDLPNLIPLTTCQNPSQTISINYAGNVILCCNDYLASVKLGNIKNEKLIQIWKKPFSKKIRKERRKGIFSLELCKKCASGKNAYEL